MAPSGVSTRWLVALLSALMIVQAGAVSPAFVVADEPSPAPAEEVSPEPSPEPTPAAPPAEPAADPPGTERIDMRTAASRTFEQADGSFVTQFYTQDVHYQPEGRTDWQQIDSRLNAVAGPGTKARADHAPAKLSLAAADDAAGFATLEGRGHSIRFHLPAGTSPGRAGTEPVIKEDGLFADYADFLPGGIGLRVFPAPDGFKSFLVLPSRPTVNSFTFAIDSPGLTLADEGDGTLIFRDRQVKVVGRISRPFLMDSSEVEGRGGGLYSEAVTMSVTSVAGPLYLLTLIVDEAFLNAAVYPVYIDPTTSDFPDGTGTVAVDTFASQKYPGSNFNTYQRPDSPYYKEMWHGKEPGTSYYNEVYFRFDSLRETLGDDVHVDSAILKFWPYWQYYHYQWRPSWVEEVTGTWAANTLTWNNRPALGDSLGQFDTKEEVWSDIDLAAYAQAVVDDPAHPNNGFMLHANGTGQGNWKRIVSRNEQNSPGLKPHLVISWHRPVATPAVPVGGAPNGRTLSWTYDPGDATYGTPQSDYWVQVSTTSGFGTVVRETTDGASGTWAPGADTAWTFPTSGAAMSFGTTYWWRVKVRDGIGESNWSSAASFVYTDEFAGVMRGEESYYTRVPFDLGDGWRMAVGVHNGELTLDRHLFEIPSYGPPQSLSLSYSSQNPDSAYLGTGWSSNLTQHLTFTGGDVQWHRADGGLVNFTLIGGVWTPTAGHFETLTAGGTEYTLTLKDQTRYVFEDSGAGRLKRIENRFGKALTVAWGTDSATATDAAGRVTNMVISGGLITSVTDSAGRQWQFGYDSGQLTTITDPAGKVSTLAYTSGLLTSMTRTRAVGGGFFLIITWSVAYSDGKVSGVTDPGNPTLAHTFTYNGSLTTVGLLKTYSPLERNTWTYTLDALGRVTASLDPEGFTTGYAFDAESNLIQLTVPIEIGPPAVNQLISYTYDTRGNVLTQTTQLTATTSVVTAMTYNATNDLLTRSEADNDSSLKVVTRYAYDASGHLTSVNENCTSSGTTPPADAGTCTGQGAQDASTNLITTYTYTANDELETETDPRGIVTKHVYNAFGNETQTIGNFVSGQSATADRNVTTAYAYDQGTTAGKAGLVTSLTDPLGRVTTYAYDLLGRQTSEVLPGDASIPALTRSTSYDEFGNVLTESEAWTGVSRTTSHFYDKLNRETRVVDPTGVVTETDYDAAGNTVETTSGGVTLIGRYDGLGNAEELQVESSTTTQDFDGRGSAIQTIDPTTVTATSEYDLGGRLVSETIESASGNLVTTYTYDLLGRETSSMTPDGVITTTGYDRVGRTLSTTVAGATTSFAYDRAGNQISTTDPDGIVTTTSYDALDRPTVVVANDVANPSLPTEDVTTTTFYDAAGNSLAVRDDDGVTRRSVYNVRGVVATSIANCTDSGTTPTTDPPNCTGAGTHDATTNVVTTTAFDGSGAALSVVGAAGTGAETTFEYAYNAAGRTQAVKDPRGTVTRTLYDSDGRVIATIANCTEDESNPAPPSTSWWTCDGSTLNDGTWNVTSSRTYDARGNVATETAPNGRVTTFVYDAADRLIERIDNDVTDTPDPDEDISTFYAYDDAGRHSAVRAPTADRNTFVVTRFIYAADGHLAKEIRNCTDQGTTPPDDPAWKTCAGNGTQDADTNLVTEYGYDSRGNLVSLTAADPSATSGSSAATVITRYALDDQNRLCGVLENASVPLASPDPCVSPGSGAATQNAWTRYLYDEMGNMVAMVDARGNTTHYGFDGSGRMINMSEPINNADPNAPAVLAVTTTWTYDELGRRVAQSRRGQPSQTLVSWTYDAAGRLISRTAAGQTTTYLYDDSGNRTTATNSSSTITTTYDRLNRPLTVTVAGDSAAMTSYTYSLTSPSWTDPSGAYVATLDAFGREVTLSDPIHGASQFSFAYRADGQLATLAAPNANTTTFGYDDAGVASTKVTAAGQTQRAAYTWTRNRAGQILSEASTITGDPSNGTTTYTYDPLARLTSYNRASSTTTYGWQPVPNRDSVQIDANPALTTTFDDANRPTSDSAGGSYSSDAEGRLTARPGQILEWNDLGQLAAVKDAATQAVIAAYSYDALDRLLVVDRGTSDKIRFRYVGLTTQVAQVVDHDAGDAVLYRVANDWTGSRLFEWTDTSQTFYGTNGHHDVTWTADPSGAVSATLRYDPWGNLTASSGAYLPAFRFQGSWFNTAVDLAWLVTRWYATGLGRFISDDTFLGEPLDPPSRHLYAYAAGEPIGRWDSTGHWWIFVRTQAREQLDGLAKRTLIGGNSWPMLWNANRRRLGNAQPHPRKLVSGCLWIPTEWVKTPIQNKAQRNDRRCPAGRPWELRRIFDWPASTTEQSLIQAQAWAHLSPDLLFNFTRSALYAFTDRMVARSRDPSPREWNKIKRRIASYDQVAAEHAKSGTIQRSRIRGVTEVIQNVNRPHFNCGDIPFIGRPRVACTLGHYIFYDSAFWLAQLDLQAHEYIHVLQYEGRPISFEETYKLNLWKAEINPEEAASVLWGAWMRAFSEKPPWDVWVRKVPVRPGGPVM